MSLLSNTIKNYDWIRPGEAHVSVIIVCSPDIFHSQLEDLAGFGGHFHPFRDPPADHPDDPRLIGHDEDVVGFGEGGVVGGDEYNKGENAEFHERLVFNGVEGR